MSSLVQVAIHASQFPENVRRDLLESLRTRRVNHKFHYDSVKQTQQWLALHQAFSPSRTDADCAATYDRSFAAVAARMDSRRVHLIGLGCGGGQKDTRLLKLLQDSGRKAFYTPSDVSTAMVLVARQTATAVIPAENCFPLVCDLASADDLPAVLDALPVARRGAAGHVLRHDPELRAASHPAAAGGAAAARRITCSSAPIWRPAPITPPACNASCRSTTMP